MVNQKKFLLSETFWVYLHKNFLKLFILNRFNLPVFLRINPSFQSDIHQTSSQQI